MEKDEFLEDLQQELGLDGDIEFTDSGAAQLTLDEDSWQEVQVWLEKNDDVDIDEESSSLTYESSNVQYLNYSLIINLIADFDAEEYKIVVKDR